MDTYQDLGVRPVINAASHYTKLGGSIMPPRVARAMADASRYFVNVFELQEAVGKRLAELTQNDAAYVSNGAAAGLSLAAAACITGEDISLMMRLPHTDGLENEVVIHRAHRNAYDIAIRQVGITLVEIGKNETQPWELEAAINERTAAVFFFAGRQFEKTMSLPLDVVVEIAHRRGVPVIVDAAGQLPPPANLWKFTKEYGADAAIFSGGKGLRGPQNSGLVVGTEAMIRAIRLNGPPVQRVGRALKVSKEAMIGLMTAVELFLETDHDAWLAESEATLVRWLAAWQPLAPNGVEVGRQSRIDASEPGPPIIVRFGPEASATRDGFVAKLQREQPVIEVVLHDMSSVAISAHLLAPGQAETVQARVSSLLREIGGI